MILTHIELDGFRNYNHCNVEFDNLRNVVCGRNAQGKTNLLEAIYVLCIARSFRTNTDRDILGFGRDSCYIRGDFVNDIGIKRQVVIEFAKGCGKRISVNRKRVTRFSEYIGQFPIVLTSPEEYRLTTGPPAERRRFFDILMSQLSSNFLSRLQEYGRILKQRNKILSEPALRTKQALDPWNDALIEKGASLIWERLIFIEQFTRQVKKIFRDFINFKEQFSINYYKSEQFSSVTDIEKYISHKLDNVKQQEYYRGQTMVGPHRDDFKLIVNDSNLRKYGSRGQHKTVLFAFMLAEYHLMKEKLNQTPIILIDDLFSEIDSVREASILKQIENLGQTFLTTTSDSKAIQKTKLKNAPIFNVHQGEINKYHESV